jgi:actin-like ATPase involved in cell morphogenesis
MLGGSPVSADAVLAKLAGWAIDRAAETEGAPPAGVAVCHPANWGAFKTDLLRQALRLVELDAVLVSEPEAAAIHYAMRERIEPGAVVAVYDLGGGTFDAAVLRRTDGGWDLLGRPQGIERLGGVDFDEVVLHHVTKADEVARAIAALDPDAATTPRALEQLRRDCVAAKEALGSESSVSIPVLLPEAYTEVRLTRAEFEAMIRPSLLETVGALQLAVRSAGVTAEDLDSVLLVGGSSRIPLVAEVVGAELRRPVSIDAHPKHSVALGAAVVAAQTAGAMTSPLAPPPSPATAMAPPVSPLPVPPVAMAETIMATPPQPPVSPAKPSRSEPTPPTPSDSSAPPDAPVAMAETTVATPPAPTQLPDPVPTEATPEAAFGSGDVADGGGDADDRTVVTWPRRRVGLIAAIAALVVVALVGVLLAFRERGDPPSARPPDTTEHKPSGRATVEVPLAVGLQKADAEQILEDAGLKVTSTDAPTTNSAADGRVMRQTPGEGTKVAPGSTVALTVARLETTTTSGHRPPDDGTTPDRPVAPTPTPTADPPPPVTLPAVPDVLGLAQADAAAVIKAAGFTVGTVWPDWFCAPDEHVTSSVVTDQDPTPGTRAAANSPVDLSTTVECTPETTESTNP